MTMSDAVLAALITGGLAIVAQLFISWSSSRELIAKMEKQSELSDVQLDAKLEKHIAVVDTKLEELTREVRIHNGFAQRMPVLEEKVANLEKKGA